MRVVKQVSRSLVACAVITYGVTGGTSEVFSWTGAAIAYAITGSASPPHADKPWRHLAYICDDFDALTRRYASAFASPDGDVTAFAKSAICSFANNPFNQTDPLTPIGADFPVTPLWFLHTFLAGAFTIQTYHGDLHNQTYYANTCWFLEDSLLAGLWVPPNEFGPGEYLKENGSLVDVESSLCASSGQYAKGPSTEYTDTTISHKTEFEVANLVSEVLARGLRIVIETYDQSRRICERLNEFMVGIRRMGFNDLVIEKVLCEFEPDTQEKAVENYLGAMTKLFTFQLLNGGTYEGYHQYLCGNLKEESLNGVRVDGKAIKDEVCAAATTAPTRI